ncbi:MAG: cytochrome B, partial [Saprospiraceae bacterium]
AAHLQLLLGLALYFMSNKVVFSGESMKVAVNRFFTAEHSLIMLLAIVLITIGYTKAKKATEEAVKFKTTFRYYLAALILVLAGIPWPFRGFGSGWF